jgi:hypothetical protein
MTIAKEALRPSIAFHSHCKAIGDLGVFAALPARISVRQERRIGKGRNRLHELGERLIFQIAGGARLRSRELPCLIIVFDGAHSG